MLYDDFYNCIISHDIQNSLQLLCKLIKSQEDETISNVFIDICAYMGFNIDISLVKKWYDIILNVEWFLFNDKLETNRILIICVKMCLIIKDLHSVQHLSLAKLRALVITNFDKKLVNHRKYENILPTPESDSFTVCCQIIACFEYMYLDITNRSNDDKNIIVISNRLRLCYEYIIRKNVYIETTINRDTDNVWFIIELTKYFIHNPKIISSLMNIYKFEWKDKYKKTRIGLIYGSVFLVILFYKKDISPEWNPEEVKMFHKISEIYLQLLAAVNVPLKEPVVVKNIIKSSDIFTSYIPHVIQYDTDIICNNNIIEKKTISY